ncbi:MAG: hypothetical protein IMZ66_11460 [Planctomycetes bacterium]|nr:hypothetical protein [Planctomycetota bacterium]
MIRPSDLKLPPASEPAPAAPSPVDRDGRGAADRFRWFQRLAVVVKLGEAWAGDTGLWAGWLGLLDVFPFDADPDDAARRRRRDW